MTPVVPSFQCQETMSTIFLWHRLHLIEVCVFILTCRIEVKLKSTAWGNSTIIFENVKTTGRGSLRQQ